MKRPNNQYQWCVRKLRVVSNSLLSISLFLLLALIGCLLIYQQERFVVCLTTHVSGNLSSPYAGDVGLKIGAASSCLRQVSVNPTTLLYNPSAADIRKPTCLDKELRSIIDTDDKEDGAIFLQGFLRLGEHNFQDATMQLKQARDLVPSDAMYGVYYGLGLLQEHSDAAASDEFVRIVNRYPWLLMNRWFADLGEFRPDIAHTVLNRVEQENTANRNLMASDVLGWVLLKKGNYCAAKASFRIVVASLPNYGRAWYGLYLASLAEGQMVEATEERSNAAFLGVQGDSKLGISEHAQRASILYRLPSLLSQDIIPFSAHSYITSSN